MVFADQKQIEEVLASYTYHCDISEKLSDISMM